MKKRQIGGSDLWVNPVAMGCWPIAGMTSTHVNDVDSVATLQAALDAGVDFLDTAFGYGLDGESEKLVGQVLKHRSDQIVIASKAGMEWQNGQRQFDASPATLVRQCELSLQRLGRDTIELFYLHAHDDKTPIEDIAACMADLKKQGKIRAVGVSNLSLQQIEAFQQVCSIDAVQDYFNMLQQSDRADVITWCQTNHASFIAYWPLMKGLLAGQLARDHRFSDMDSRQRYDIYKGEQWQRNQDFVDCLRTIAADAKVTVSQLVIAWTLQVPGIHSVLCGAKRPYQILETAQAMHIQLEPTTLDSIDEAIQTRKAIA